MTRPFLSSAAAVISDPHTEILAATNRQDGTDTSAVPPGSLASFRELVDEMLREMKRPSHAPRAFEATRKEPNRFRTLYRAAKAASLADDRDKARCCRQLLDICARPYAPGRAEIQDVRKPVQP